MLLEDLEEPKWQALLIATRLRIMEKAPAAFMFAARKNAAAPLPAPAQPPLVAAKHGHQLELWPILPQKLLLTWNHFYCIKQLTGLLLNWSPTRNDTKLEGRKKNSDVNVSVSIMSRRKLDGLSIRQHV
jgi:hypothetical protein